MRRRDVLRIGGAVTTAVLAGCLTGDGGTSRDESAADSGTDEDPSPPWSRSETVYYPGHAKGMQMIGMARPDDRAIALTYTYPERFWTVTGTRTERVGVDEQYNGVHLMASVWDTETGTVLPVESGLRFEVRGDDGTITERSPWPMLSQQMGFHFGDNVALPGNGTYSVVVDAGAMNLERRGALAGKFERSRTVSFEFEFSRPERNTIGLRKFQDRRGTRGAISPMEMEMLPLSVAPSGDELPGRVLGEAESGDAVLLATAADSDGGTYLAVSLRTPYNGYVLPMMALSATLERDGSTVFEGPLQKAIDPDRAYHYGAVVDGVEAGDELTVTVDAPPQVSRHEGYETAFLDMPEVTYSV